ncbi:hypothetical protein [Rhizobium laguerreae]|uniref:hypothetical protein n=1 Tax=Rhizobium laguerreae TaxID=1076926 RepID=UPI00103EFED6|nr:hypothetical protein [Rhizobium laguerreae]TBY00562.1 hypothetical protein E0I94_33260 [Rhizobium laguerreae]
MISARFRGKQVVVAGAICLGAALLVGVAVQNYETSKKLSKLRAEDEKTSEQLTQVSDSLKQLSNLPLAYAETPEGLKLVPAEYGVSKDDLDFVKRYRGPLLDLTTDFNKLSPNQVKELLRTRLLAEFESDPKNLTLAKTKRGALITFAMLRVNGSMPTYEVRNSVPNDFRNMLLGTSGNCSDFTIRVMMVAEVLGLKAALISANTPALPGHVFADVYDSEEDTAYMLDANFDVQIARNHTEGRGFFEALLASGADEQDNFSRAAKVKALPVYFRFVDPGETGLYGTPLSASYINKIRSKREDTWRRWTSEDLDDLVDWWKRIPNHRPRTLAEMRTFLTAIPAEFNSSSDYAERLRRTVDVELIEPDRIAQATAK